MKTTKPLLIFLFCAIFHNLNAQFFAGIKSGFTRVIGNSGVANLSGNIHSPNFSTLAYFEINPHFKIGLEPGFVKKATDWLPTMAFANYNRHLLNYLEAPFMLSFDIPLYQNKIELFGKVGFGPSYLIGSKNENITFGQESSTISNHDTSQVERWDIGFYGSFGFAYNIGISQLFLEAIYYHGLQNVYAAIESKNRNINFGIGYLIKL